MAAVCLGLLVAPAPAPAAKVFGLDLGPYTDGQGPAAVTVRTLRRRLLLIRPYTSVRTFGCGLGLAKTGTIGHEIGMSIALGASLSKDPVANDRELDCLIGRINAGDVDLAIVGSETLLRRELSASTLVDYINRVKRATAGSGVPVATADTDLQLLANPSVMSASDVLLPNVYPYFDGVDVSAAVQVVAARYRRLQAAEPGKEIRVSESGWPSCGGTIGQAIASPENAAAYFAGFESWARAAAVRAYYFEALDEPWKAKYEGLAGACWGITDNHGALKPGTRRVFAGGVRDRVRPLAPCSGLRGPVRRRCHAETAYGVSVETV